MTSKIWQVDFYHHPLIDDRGVPLWRLFVCDVQNSWELIATCSQGDANFFWLTQQFEQLIKKYGFPDILQVFRPQCLRLIEQVGTSLNIEVIPTRKTWKLKTLLEREVKTYSQLPNYTGEFFDPTKLNAPPPLPLPENLWGEKWGFVSLSAGELIETFAERPIPILSMPEDLFPLNLGIASHLLVPGIMIEGGRRAMQLARWLEEITPISLNYISGNPDGLILEGGLVDRWIVATFTDPEMTQAAYYYEQRKNLSQGLHFLLVQPDRTGVTHTGFWLLHESS